MKVFILSAVITLIHARSIDEKCNMVTIKNVKYEKEVLKENLDRPYQLVVDYETDYLFFSYSAHTDEVFKSAYINLKNHDFAIIPGIDGGFASAVDYKNHKVYLGGSNGVYEFDYNKKEAKHLGGTEYSIWQMFYKNKLYFTSYPEEEIYTFKDGKVLKVPELDNVKTRLVGVDKNDNLYFANSTGMFCYNQGSVINLGDYFPNGFVSDTNGNLYFSTFDGIYTFDNNKIVEKLVSIIDIDSIFGIAVDGNGNIIYATSTDLVRLKPTNKVCTSN